MSRFRDIPGDYGGFHMKLDVSRVVAIKRGQFDQAKQDNYADLLLDSGAVISTGLMFNSADQYLQIEDSP